MHAHSLQLYIDFNDVSDVVRHYQQKQANDRAGSSSKSRNRSSATSPRCYSVCYNSCVFVLSIMQYSVYTAEFCPIQKGREVWLPNDATREDTNIGIFRCRHIL